MAAPGEKGKQVGIWDSALADTVGLSAIYKIEVFFTKSPQTGTKCGSIVIFKNNSIDLQVNPLLVDSKKLQEMEEELSQQTEMMYRDPVYFSENQGQWIEWAIEEAFRLYDDLGGADIVIKAPRLKIKEIRRSSDVAMGRSDPLRLFRTLKDINRLFDGNFNWDPWSRSIRRGDINAEKGKRK